MIIQLLYIPISFFYLPVMTDKVAVQDSKYWGYLKEHYAGPLGKLKLENKLKHYDLDIATGRGSFFKNLSSIRDFQIINPKIILSPEELDGKMFIFEEMTPAEKRNATSSLRKLMQTLSPNNYVRIGLFREDVVTGERDENPIYKTLGRDIDIDMLIKIMKGTMSPEIHDLVQIDDETPATDFKDDWHRIWAFNLKIHTYKIGNRKTRGGASGSFRYNLIDDAYDLSRYQIYNEHQCVDTMPCFIYALKQSGKVSDAIISSIYKAIENIYFVETKTVGIIAREHRLDIHINYIDFDEDGHKRLNTWKSSSYLNPQKTIYLNCMFNHFFVDDKLRVNLNYYQYRDDERLKADKKLLVWKKNGKSLRYYKNESEIKEDYAHNVIPSLYKAGAFKLIEKHNSDKYKFKKRSVRPYSFEEISPRDYRLYQYSNENEPENAYQVISMLYSKIPEVYQVTGNVYNIIKNCEYGGQYLFTKPIHVTDPLYCLDFNSMYSASFKHEGVTTSYPELIHSADEGLRYNSHMLINITKVGKHRKFDVLDNLHEGIRFVRTWDLKDLIKYNEIEFDFIAGIAFKGERNFSLNEYIDRIYKHKQTASDEAERKKYKAILNKQMYGMTLFHGKTTQRTKYVDDAKLDYYYDNKPLKIVRARKISENRNEVVLSKKITNAYNLAHIGTDISSYARHMLHEVIYGCEDNGIEVYHGYTDSLYIKQSDFDKFKELFPNAIGDGIGQLKIEKVIDEAVFTNRITYGLKLADGTYKFSGMYDHKLRNKSEIECFNKLIECVDAV